jgi:hypothetical protein
MKENTLSGDFKLGTLNKDLPRFGDHPWGPMGIYNSRPEQWSTKELGCQIDQLWYNRRIKVNKGRK